MRKPRAAAAAAAAVIALFTSASVAAAPADASGEPAGARMLDWAETQAGKPYVWGAAGPGGYDCSGLVYAAAARLGLTLPRTTFGLAGGGPRLRFVPVSEARRGDLLLFGAGHVEFATVWRGVSFGAQHSGTRVGWHRWGGWWRPTAALRVTG